MLRVVAPAVAMLATETWVLLAFMTILPTVELLPVRASAPSGGEGGVDVEGDDVAGDGGGRGGGEGGLDGEGGDGGGVHAGVVDGEGAVAADGGVDEGGVVDDGGVSAGVVGGVGGATGGGPLGAVAVGGGAGGGEGVPGVGDAGVGGGGDGRAECGRGGEDSGVDDALVRGLHDPSKKCAAVWRRYGSFAWVQAFEKLHFAIKVIRVKQPGER